jgi:hypothetical protein
MEPGICKLCDKQKDLCDSHYVPAVVYKYSRGKELKNPSPVMLRGDSPKQGTIQARDYVFCQECERRLNENGERWISQIIPTDYGAPFPLLEALKKANPVTREPGRVRLSTVGVQNVEIEKLLYFAASVFWRGAVHEWPDPEGVPVPTLDLGDYQDSLKLYLRGENPFPSDLYVTVMLWPFQKVPPGLIFPDTYPNAKWKRFWFYISGIGFVLDVGSEVPEDVKKYSTSGSAQRLVTVDEQFGIMAWETIKAMVGDVSRFGALINEIAAVRAKGKPSV